MESLWGGGWTVDRLGTKFKTLTDDVWIDVTNDMNIPRLLRGDDIQWADDDWEVDWGQKNIRLDYYNDSNAAVTLRRIVKGLGNSTRAMDANLFAGSFKSHNVNTGAQIAAVQNHTFKYTPELARLVYQLGELRWALYGSVLIETVKALNPILPVAATKATYLALKVMRALHLLDKAHGITRLLKDAKSVNNVEQFNKGIEDPGSIPD